MVRWLTLLASGWGTVAGCAPSLEPGEWGTVRYFADVRGEPPMRLLPPLTDRQGTVYVLQGAPDRTDTQVFVGTTGGSWSGGCSAHRGVTGLHGFVGRSTDRAWYWAGTALVQVDGGTGACRQVLPTDPVSGTELSFLGVAPHIDETPSRRFAYGLVQGATGSPQFVMVDLDRGLPFNAVPFPGGDTVDVVATGAWPAVRATVFVVESGGETVAYFLDRLGQIVREVPIDAARDLDAYEVPAYLQFSDDGVGVGITTRGRILMVSVTDGGLTDAPFEPLGLLSWGGDVYVTGLESNDPVAARVRPDGTFDEPVPFAAARRAQNTLPSLREVQDERGAPARPRAWDTVTSATGSHVLISPWPLDTYTRWSTSWLLAGPSFPSGVEPITAVAVVPVGVSAP